MPRRITEIAYATMDATDRVVLPRNPNRVAIHAMTDAGIVRVFPDIPVSGSPFGYEVRATDPLFKLTEEDIGESIKKEIHAVGAPGVRITLIGITDS